jgi:hypothetical protein
MATIAALYTFAESGYPKMAFLCAIMLAFVLPISTITFTVSLFVSNWFGAGIDLVEFSTLIPKSLLLVLLASIVGLLPCVGPMVSIGVWFIGAMIFFHLEAWETRFLVGVNWVLGWVMWLALARVVAALATKG